MNVDSLGPAFLAGAVVLLVAVAAVRLSTASGLPSLLLYIGLGLLIGESGLGVRFDDADLTGVIGYAALVIILAEGGLSTRWSAIKPVMAPALVLATVGTAVSIAVTGYAAHWLLDLDLTSALLLGAAVSVTDAAAVFSVLRRVPLPGRLVGLLEAESGFNDAPAVIALVTLLDVARGGSVGPWWQLLLIGVAELAGGAAVGLVVGRAAGLVLRRVALPAAGLYPITVIGVAAGSYGAAASVHASGFLATYLSCLVLGSVRLPHGAAVRGFADGLGWLAQIGLFVLLGLLASPSRLPGQIGGAVAIGLVLLLVARPLSVLLTTSWFGVGLRDQAFLSWAGLRGAVPIVLATIPLGAGVDGARRVFDIVFVLVVMLTAVQGPTLPRVARLLRVSTGLRTVDLDIDASPLGAIDADVVHIRIGDTSRLHGVEIFELRLPPRANVTLIVRGNDSFVPGPRTTLHSGDDLILVTDAAARDATVRRLEAVSEQGRLAGWGPTKDRAARSR